MSGILRTKYNIKPMVAARLMAECTVLLILCFLPLAVVSIPQLQQAEFILKLILCVLSPISAVILIAAARLPYRVTVDQNGIEVVALLQSFSASWNDVRGVRLISKLGFRVYEILDQEQRVLLFFPLWFKNLSELIESIRLRLPDRGLTQTAGDRVFRQDVVVLMLQILKGGAQIGFVAAFWWFFVHYNSHNAKLDDTLFLLLAGVIFTGISIWKFYLLLTMPQHVSLQADKIVCQGILGARTLVSSQVTEVKPANLLQPEGVVIKAGKDTILIGASLESFDELEESLRAMVARGSLRSVEVDKEHGHK